MVVLSDWPWTARNEWAESDRSRLNVSHHDMSAGWETGRQRLLLCGNFAQTWGGMHELGLSVVIHLSEPEPEPDRYFTMLKLLLPI